MPKSVIAITDGVLANAAFEVLEALSFCNRYTSQQYASREALPPSMETRLVSPTGEPVMAENGRLIPVEGPLTGEPADLIYVAPFAIGAPEDLDLALRARADIVDWMKAHHAKGALAAASGTAVGLAARAGLASDLTVPVAWWLERPMRRLFPTLTLDASLAIGHSDTVLLGGQHRSEPALAIRLVERLMSPDVAGWMERISGVDPYPDGPDETLPVVICEDELVVRAAHWLQLRFARRPQVEDLAHAMAVHPRTLSRRFRAGLGMTPVDYLQRLRVEAAKQMLARSDRKPDRIGYLVGYGDPGFFKRVFRRQTGLTPADYRRQARLPASPGS